MMKSSLILVFILLSGLFISMIAEKKRPVKIFLAGDSTCANYTSIHYFMNLPTMTYQVYPDGQKDNTHFQPAGAKPVAQLVFDSFKILEVKR